MKIVLTVPLEEPVPPRKYGGIELVVYNLLEHLVKQGHETYLLGTGDSHTSAHLVPIVEKSIRAAYGPDEIDTWREFIKISSIADALKHIDQIQPDIVHNHFAWRFVQFADLINCPVMSTMHGAMTSHHEVFTYRKHPTANYISISDNQRKALPDLNWAATVYNGIEVDAFQVGAKQDREYFVFLGRTSPEKGLKEICQMVRKTKYGLKIAAKLDTVDQAYFEQEVQPLIDDNQIEFVGEVDHAGKAELLKHAKALLLWLNWEEPFGLVVTEAMAAGTPVIVNPRGAMPELIVDGKTGFLVDSMDEMQASMERVSQIEPAFCRAHVEKNFSASKMAQDYVTVAEKLISAGK